MKRVLIFLLCILLVPVVNAQELIGMQVYKNSYAPGETVQVEIMLDQPSSSLQP